ncbi:DsbA family protein [Gammaproteobacteria bacterium]|nr:DsbA family protein [Gammaproteobacteria bacterium]MDA7829403.1 DsbA family protein [Gammaproteobacteria bacterium]MDA7844108.1 DsbA family protein [Gammaproteobacteria bacterium]MDA9102239.1 DsbA family protein [Gammaproteobacteria bacterium]MDA9356119.1 DsbA family protein [Gammaproteobacteria bacterium]
MSKRTIAAPVRNRIMNSFSNYEAFKSVRLESEVKRQDEGRNHEVLYFHKVDDPYSHLTIQSIEKLKSSYNISFKPILVGEEDAEAIHETSLYSKYCLEDVKRIAPFYDIAFPGNSYPSKEMIYKANSILSAVNESKFSEIAIKVSFALWSGDIDTIDNLVAIFSSSKDKVIDKIIEGNKIRNDNGYYFGSAFYYENELYWGLDRLNYLEGRLSELGLSTNTVKDPICSLNLSAPKHIISNKKVNLTYYPSLNSPYTLVSAKRVKELSETYPINLITKPVLPMLMRDMTIPEYKAKYIISDAAREGRKYGHEIKNIYSPLGSPARKAYSLFPNIDKAGKGFEYIYELLNASFQEGVNIGNNDYLETLINKLGLDWSIIKNDLNTKQWKHDLDLNLKDMYSGNCWGVPSFKVTDEDGSNPFYAWGQDRIWLIKEEIAKRL